MSADGAERLRLGRGQRGFNIEEVGVDSGGLSFGDRRDAVDRRLHVLALVRDRVAHAGEGAALGRRCGVGVGRLEVVNALLTAAGDVAGVDHAETDVVRTAEIGRIELDARARDRRVHARDAREAVDRRGDVRQAC